MERLGTVPNTGCYNSMIQVYAKSGRRVDAEAWMEKLRTVGGGANEHSYSALMDAYAINGQFAETEALMVKGREQGIRLNRVHYNTAMKARANAGDPRGAEHWFNLIEKEAGEPQDKY